MPNKLKNVKWNKSSQEDSSKSCQSTPKECTGETNKLCENNLVQGPNSVNLAAPDILSALQLANAIQAVSYEKRSLHKNMPEPPNLLKVRYLQYSGN